MPSNFSKFSVCDAIFDSALYWSPCVRKKLDPSRPSLHGPQVIDSKMAMDVSVTVSEAFDAWFSENEIEEFKPIFLRQGFKDLETVMEITSKEELREMGITLLGSQLKLLSRIRTLKRPAADEQTPPKIEPKRLKQSSKSRNYDTIFDIQNIG